MVSGTWAGTRAAQAGHGSSAGGIKLRLVQYPGWFHGTVQNNDTGWMDGWIRMMDGYDQPGRPDGARRRRVTTSDGMMMGEDLVPACQRRSARRSDVGLMVVWGSSKYMAASCWLLLLAGCCCCAGSSCWPGRPGWPGPGRRYDDDVRHAMRTAQAQIRVGGGSKQQQPPGQGRSGACVRVRCSERKE